MLLLLFPGVSYSTYVKEVPFWQVCFIVRIYRDRKVCSGALSALCHSMLRVGVGREGEGRGGGGEELNKGVGGEGGRAGVGSKIKSFRIL